MRILEFNTNELSQACFRLAHVVNAPNELIAVIGIRSGGAYVGRCIHAAYAEQGLELVYHELTCRRPSTKAKKASKLDSILPHLPRWLVNLLRRVEARIVSLKLKLRGQEPREVELHDGLSEFLEDLDGGRVLLVDDALDSGSSMKAVAERLTELNPAVKYEVAVLTVTQQNPVYRPDYTLYQQTLIRFPWAMDSKQKINQ